MSRKLDSRLKPEKSFEAPFGESFETPQGTPQENQAFCVLKKMELFLIQTLLMENTGLRMDAIPVKVLAHIYEKTSRGTCPCLFGQEQRVAFSQMHKKELNTVDKAVTFLKSGGFIEKVGTTPGLFKLGEIFSQASITDNEDGIVITIKKPKDFNHEGEQKSEG